MSNPTFKVGDRVQLKSGGAPMTVVGYTGWLWWKYQVAAISPGGLLQSMPVDGAALKPYEGKPTAPSRRVEIWDI
jgi:hypothetical protein